MSEDTNRANPKPPSVDRLSQLWRRINDHKMVQWSVAYVALAYGFQHGVELTSDAFEWPQAVVRVSMLLLALGLPLVMTLAWYHGERASRRISGPELTIIALLAVTSSLLFYVFVRPANEAGVPVARQAGLTAARTAAADPHSAISVAVLPFVNLSSDKEQEFFSDGMTEEITAALAKIPDLRVVARTSAFQFKGEKKDMRALGQALSATHLIEGSVRKAGDRVRITAQLIKADDGTHIWTENYDRDLTDVFAIQEDIAQAIAGALRMPLGLKLGERLVANRSIDPESYQQYLRTKPLVRARASGMPQAIDILEPLVARNPDFAPAWALLAASYALSPNFARPGDARRHAVEAFYPKAEAAGHRAIQVDPNLADAYWGLCRLERQRGKLLHADELCSKALTLDPNNPDALQQYVLVLAVVGRLKEALAMSENLHTLEPYVPAFNTDRGEMLWENGQSEAAIEVFKASTGVNSSSMLAMINASMGRYGEAVRVLEPLAAKYPDYAVAVNLLRTAPTKAATPLPIARFGLPVWIYLYVGARDRALEPYEEAVDIGFSSGGDNAFLWHPSYAQVRQTERFKAFARKAGMVEYWRAKGWPEFCHPTTGDDFVCT